MSKEINQIAVIGLGYIGLPTAAVFAQRSKKVVGVDIDENVVNIINNAKIHGDGIGKLVSAVVNKGLCIPH